MKVSTPFPGCLGQFAPGAAGADADVTTRGRTAAKDDGRRAEDLRQPQAQLVPIHGAGESDRDTQVPAVVFEERLGRAEPERLRQLSRVAQLGMPIERQMLGIDREVALDQSTQELVAAPGPRDGAVPEEPVMHQQQVGLGGERQVHGGPGGVDGSGDATDRPRVLHLESVPGTVVVLVDRGLETAFAVLDDPLQGHRFHEISLWVGDRMSTRHHPPTQCPWTPGGER